LYFRFERGEKGEKKKVGPIEAYGRRKKEKRLVEEPLLRIARQG